MGLAVALLVFQLPVAAGTANLKPDGDFTAGWKIVGAGDGSCSGLQCDVVDEDFSTPNVSNYIMVDGTTAGGEIDEFTMGSFVFPAGVTDVTSLSADIFAQSATDAAGGALDTVSISMFIGGVYQTAVTVTPAFNSWNWYSATFNGTWTQADIDGMRFRVVRNIAGTADEVRIATANVAAKYPTAATFNQSASRWFVNRDDVAPDTALAAQDAAITAPSRGTPFRLRLLIDVATNPIPAGSETFKLQYAARSGTCDTLFSGETYSDLSANSGAIRFYNNQNPASGMTTSAVAGDPAHSTHPTRPQTYVEAATFTNTASAISVGEDGLWDFSLVDYSALPGASYCFRAVKSDGATLNGYTAIPEIKTQDVDTGIQYKNDHITQVPVGSTNNVSSTSSMFMDFFAVAGTSSEDMTPQVEVKDTNTAFGGAPNYLGTKVSTKFGVPNARFASCSAYDSLGKRMIIFGGRANDGTTHYNDAWALNTPTNAQPSWTKLTAQGAAGSPPVVRTCAATYDSTGNRFIIWNGWNGSTQYTDVWALSLGDTPAWTRLCTATSCGTAPSVRRASRIVYDPVGNQMIIWGGYNGGNLNDTWRLTLGATPAWTNLNPSGPPVARGSYTFAYDPVNRLAWMFGGSAAAGDMNDTWKYDIASNTWTQVFANGCASPCPVRRDGSTMVYDSLNRRMIVFAGYDTAVTTFLKDFAILSNLDTTPVWSSPAPASEVPEPRYYHSSVYDEANQRMITFSGYDGTVKTLNKDISALYLPSGGATPYWRGISAGNVWNPRDQMATYYDSDNKYAYSFGGFGNGPIPGANDSGVHISETHRLEVSPNRGARWRNVSPQNQGSTAGTPLAREAASYATDTTRKRLVVFGGLHGDFVTSDLWAAEMKEDGSNPVWAQLCSPTSCGTAPPARWGGVAVYDANSDRLVIFGGRTSGSVNYNDVWSLPLNTPNPTWTQLAPSGTAPAARWSGAAAYDALNNRMIIFGGQTNPDASATRYNDVWSLSLGASPAWTQLTPSGTAPSARRSMAYALSTTGGVNKLVVFGGYNGTSHYNDIFSLDLSTANGAWTNPFPSDCANATAPSCRRSTSAVHDPVGNRFIAIAGRNASAFVGDSYSFDMTSNTWTNLNPVDELAYSVEVTGLSDNSYRWQYRTNGSASGVSPFTAYGGNSDTLPASTDFSYCSPPSIDKRLRLGGFFCGQAEQDKYIP